MMMKSKEMLAAVTALVSCAAFAKDIWVDADNFGKQNLDGQTEATAFGTIQDGVNVAAASGDTVWVKPGTYDKGDPAYDGYIDARVSLAGKQVVLRSTGGRDVTFIVGRQ